MGAPQHEFERMNSLAGLGAGLSQMAWQTQWQGFRNLGAAANQEESMLAEFVQKIISIAEPVIREESDGRVYSDKALLACIPPPVQTIQIHTLTGFRDLYNLTKHLESGTHGIIQIEDHSSVWLMARDVDVWQRRAAYVHAKLAETEQFKFNTWMDPEQFVISLMTQFEDADNAYGDHSRVVKLVNNLAAEAVTTSLDDGLSQQVVTKQGVVSKSEEKVSPRARLQPYRTFREISQPSTEFVLRLRSRQGQTPSCSLWEADGGAWRNHAMQSIREYFQRELPGADIVA